MGDTADATAGPTAGLGEVPTLGARASLAKDAIILVVVALLSVLPYASRLGFYSDDWEYLALLQNAPDHSLIGLVRTQYAFKAHLRMRPTQIVTQALLFKAFGLKAQGYHIVNALVLASLAVFFYLVLREVGTEGDVAFAASAIYILLPNYSTDRFWFAAFSYLISMTLFLVGLYALLKAAEGPRYWRWTTAGLLALLVAMSGLETVIPLTVSIPLGLWLKHQGRGMAEWSGRIGTARAWLLLSAPLVAAAAVVYYKAATARTAAVPGAFYAVRLAVGSAAVNFGTYGVALPHTVGWALHHISRGGACLGAVIGTVVFLRIAREAPLPRSGRFWRHLTAVGFAVFLLGDGNLSHDPPHRVLEPRRRQSSLVGRISRNGAHPGRRVRVARAADRPRPARSTRIRCGRERVVRFGICNHECGVDLLDRGIEAPARGAFRHPAFITCGRLGNHGTNSRCVPI